MVILVWNIVLSLIALVIAVVLRVVILLLVLICKSDTVISWTIVIHDWLIKVAKCVLEWHLELGAVADAASGYYLNVIAYVFHWWPCNLHKITWCASITCLCILIRIKIIKIPAKKLYVAVLVYCIRKGILDHLTLWWHDILLAFNQQLWLILTVLVFWLWLFEEGRPLVDLWIHRFFILIGIEVNIH